MKKTTYLLLLIYCLPSLAVYVNPKGTGEVLLIPYYTVNNGLNTLVSITNTTEHAKAVKITFRESQNGYAALSYNVYLSRYDVWSFALTPTTSTLSGHQNETSVMHITSDTSCAPMLNKAGEEFSNAGLIDGPQELDRIREGFIEITEMGELEGSAAAWADHGILGAPAACEQFESSWNEGGIWHENSGGDSAMFMKPGSGGLKATANLVDVGQGINYTYPAVVLADFWDEDQFSHEMPGDSNLSLDAAAPQVVVIANEQPYHLTMASGIDAVSAALLAQYVVGDYALDRIVAGKTELVFTFPTRRFYVDVNAVLNQPPFQAARETESCRFNIYGGNQFSQVNTDSEGKIDLPSQWGGGPRPPRPPAPAFCGSVSVQSLELPEIYNPNSILRPGITGSYFYSRNGTPEAAVAESGWMITVFYPTQPLTGVDAVRNQVISMDGLPVIGLTLYRFSNSNSQPGLLAQYGGAELHRPQTKIQAGEG